MAKAARKNKVIIAALIVVILAVVGGVIYLKRHDLSRALERASLPEAVEYEEAQLPTSEPIPFQSSRPEVTDVTPAPQQGGTGTGPASTLAAEVNLAVPFTPQAPHANWEDPYGELCEEASVLMAVKYLKGETIQSPDAADRDLLAIKAFEEQRFGYYKDTTAAETAVILREYFKIDAVELIPNPTVSDIKQAVAAGKLVLVPAAGRLLGNPYYTAPGPLYHMFIIKGYTSDGKFITNDPGTRRGADFLFSESTVMNAMHDWRADRDIEKGEKVIVIVG